LIFKFNIHVNLVNGVAVNATVQKLVFLAIMTTWDYLMAVVIVHMDF